MKLIFDLDHHIYRSAASCSPTKAKPFQEPMEEAIWRFESSFNQVLLDLNSDDYECYMGGEGNWRYAIYPDYKLNRRGVPRPLWLEDVREHALLKYKAEIVNEKEADDMCGIRLTQEGDKAICVSLDKDLLTIPGYHYNWVKRVRTLVSPLDALRNFYKQVITGDASDHIPSFDNMYRSKQPQFVEKLLASLDEMTEEIHMYEYCQEVYETYWQNQNMPGESITWEFDHSIMHRNAQVLYIQKEEGGQWQPPNHGQKPDGIPS